MKGRGESNFQSGKRKQSKLTVVRRDTENSTEQEMWGNVILRERHVSDSAWTFNLSIMRLREIEKIVRHRHGHFIPDPEGTDDVDLCLNYVRAAVLSSGDQVLPEWCNRFAPWVPPDVLSEIAREAYGRKGMISADAVAQLLYVRLVERTKLDLRTIGACDVSKEERFAIAASNKKARDRQRQAEKRRSEGKIDRAAYERNSLSRTEPWVAEGISRRTWERRRRVAGLSRIESK